MAEQQEILTINVRTPSANVDWLKRVAAEQDRSMNYVASKLITEARERDQQAKAA